MLFKSVSWKFCGVAVLKIFVRCSFDDGSDRRDYTLFAFVFIFDCPRPENGSGP